MSGKKKMVLTKRRQYKERVRAYLTAHPGCKRIKGVPGYYLTPERKVLSKTGRVLEWLSIGSKGYSYPGVVVMVRGKKKTLYASQLGLEPSEVEMRPRKKKADRVDVVKQLLKKKGIKITNGKFSILGTARKIGVPMSTLYNYIAHGYIRI